MDVSRFVAVLGMHRSGTSAVTRALNMVGVLLPGELMHNTHHNSSGHWEALEAVRIHDALFAAQQYTWDDPFIPADICTANSGAATQAKTDIAAFIAHHVQPASTFAIKDPRLCHGLPLWLDCLNETAINPYAIIMVRNPLEVAASLAARDKMPTTIGMELWLRYMLAAEYNTRTIPRVVLQYDHLLHDWHSTLQPVFTLIGITPPLPDSDVGRQLSAFLSQGEQHHRHSLAELARQTQSNSAIAACYTHCMHDINTPDARMAFDQIRQDVATRDALIPEEYTHFLRYHTQQSIAEINTLKAELAWRSGIQQAQIEELAWRKSVMIGHKLEP